MSPEQTLITLTHKETKPLVSLGKQALSAWWRGQQS